MNTEMFCHLPKPYPDELLYSVIARFIIHIGAKNKKVVGYDIFGRNSKPNTDLPHSLNTLSRRTYSIWQMSGENIANELTLFPFYSRYLSEERAAKCLEKLRSDNTKGLRSMLGINGSRVKVPPFLRFCSVCRDRDISLYGETFWHRTHQLAGVLVCAEHRVPLITTKVPFRPHRYLDFVDATLNTTNQTIFQVKLDEYEMINAVKIAQRCNDILIGQVKHWLVNDVPPNYRKECQVRGFVEKDLSVSQARVENEFVKFYGENLLSKIGCSVKNCTRSSWLTTIFQKQRSTFHPLEHALVQIFLESIPVNQSISHIGVGPWKCPNPYAKHDQTYPIKKVKILNKKGNHLEAYALCDCGFKFTFIRTSDYDSKLPVVNRRIAFGPAWVEEAKRLKEAGSSIYNIRTRMGIHYSTVKILLNPKSKNEPPSLNEIKKLRHEWLKALKETPNQNRTIAKSKKKSLYRKLRLYDKDWLFAEPINKSTKPHVQMQIDWVKRDQQWSEKLRIAATRIKEVFPCEQITKKSIIAYAGITSSIWSYLKRLPLCSLVLNELSESIVEFKTRCLNQAKPE